MCDQIEEDPVKKPTILSEAQKVQVQIVESIFVELAQGHRHAENHFQAGYHLLLLGEFSSALRCFDDASFYAVTLARKYDRLRASIRPLREFAIISADSAAEKSKTAACPAEEKGTEE